MNVVYIVLFRYEWVGIQAMAIVGLLYSGFYISDLLTKLIYNSLPRHLIDNTNDKAVLVTGVLYYYPHKAHNFFYLIVKKIIYMYDGSTYRL